MLPYLYVWCILLKQSHHIPFVCILDGYWGNFRYIWHFEGWRRRYVFVVILTAVYVVGVIVVVVQLHCHFTIWLFWLKKYFIWFSTVPVSHVLHQWLHLMKDYSAHSNVTNNFHAKIFYVLGRGERGGKKLSCILPHVLESLWLCVLTSICDLWVICPSSRPSHAPIVLLYW